MVFSRTTVPAHLKCQDCGGTVARPGYAPAPGVPSMGAHVAAHKAAEHEQRAA